ncbi:MAG: discoidin domain-containing protein, partial [Phycisphaeraceae bacterium]|nr:discoidin domain-containing protein [Phycisphaeraceae bacterium]
MFKEVNEKTALLVLSLIIGFGGLSIGYGQTVGPVMPWSHADVGSPDAGDAVTADGKIFQITGAGNDIWGTSDNFHYMFIPLDGDGAMSVLVTDNGTGANAWTKGGVMIRETLEGGSKNVFVAITGGSGEGATFQWRNAADAASASNRTKPAPVAPPYWVRLVREGNTFSGYLSEDGETWYQEGASQEIELADPVYIGLAVTSHQAGELRTFTFENVVGEGNAALADPGAASAPSPVNESSDVLRDSSLTWGPGVYAASHNVYLSNSFDDVNEGAAAALLADGITETAFDPGRLTFGNQYFWRVDEVNGTPDKTVFKGDVWTFEVEPYSIQIPGNTIAVTASSASNEFSIPEKTIDGSGLGANDAHGIASENMWFTAAVDLDPWIQYEFDAVKKLDTMTVWNSNSAAEMAIGWGVKDVEIAYSVDGETWDVLEGATQLSRAPGFPTYNNPDVIAFNGVAAKYVRLNIASNWGGILMSYGISEAQFNMIPAAARTPDPADGSADVVPNAVATWRAGREAAQSTVYVSTDEAAVADGSAPSLTSSTNSADLSSLDLALSTTYYLRVDEVNEAEAISVWA